MSQRSQIYISYKNGKNETVLIARYFGWNFGSRMVSRAAGIIGWIKDTVNCSPYKVSEAGKCSNFVEKLIRVCDVNFDFRDIVVSQDIVEEAKEYRDYHCDTPEDYIFNYTYAETEAIYNMAKAAGKLKDGR